MEITLKDFTSVTDLEKSKYLMMNKLKFCEKELDESKLYPTFQMLINVYQQLIDVMEKRTLIFDSEYADNEDKDLEKQNIMNIELEKLRAHELGI
jgi:hypothetical protein